MNPILHPRFFLCFFLMACLTACSPSVLIYLQRPAEVNVTKYKKIAVSAFSNPNHVEDNKNIWTLLSDNLPNINYENAGTDLADMITTKIVEGGRFEVVDRQNLDKIMQEQKLSAQGLTDEKNAIEIGNLAGASAIIFGGITAANYKEDPMLSSTSTSKDGKKTTTNTRSGTFNYRGNIKFVDATTSQVIAVKNIDLGQSISVQAINQTPEAINANAYYRNKERMATDMFMKMITPYTLPRYVYFEKDKMMPELKQYVTMFQEHQTEIALKGLEELASRNYPESKVKAKALYNYATILTWTGSPEKAITIFDEVNRIMPGEIKYLRALSEAQNEIKIKSKLKEQGL